MEAIARSTPFYSARKVEGRWQVVNHEDEGIMECESRSQAEDAARCLNDSLFKKRGITFVSLDAVKALAKYNACDCILTIYPGYNDFELSNEYMAIHLANEYRLYDRYSVIEKPDDDSGSPSAARVSAMHSQLRKGPICTTPFIRPKDEW